MNAIRRKKLSNLAALFGELMAELEDLREEEEEYRDNIPENLQGSERYEKAANILGISIPDVEAIIAASRKKEEEYLSSLNKEEYLSSLNGEELVAEIYAFEWINRYSSRVTSEWASGLIRELCWRADIDGEYDEALDTLEDVDDLLKKAANILGIRLPNPF